MSRRRRPSEANIWPGFVDGLTTLLLVLMFVLSIFVVPLALAAFWFAFRRRFATHRQITRWALPIWLYVSVTGVVIYLFLRSSAPAVR